LGGRDLLRFSVGRKTPGRSLARKIRRYINCYNEDPKPIRWTYGNPTWRTHLSLDEDAPVSRAVQPPTRGRIAQVPHLGGLHHHYERRAA
jgi:hypothetical protein